MGRTADGSTQTATESAPPPPPSEEQLFAEQLFEEADVNNDGVLDQEEYEAICEKKPAAVRRFLRARSGLGGGNKPSPGASATTSPSSPKHARRSPNSRSSSPRSPIRRRPQ